MADLPADETDVTSSGNYTEAEYELSAADAGDFLVELGELLRAGDDVTLSGDDWNIDFAYHDTVELEIEHVEGPDGELEIELELSAAGADESPPSLG